MGVEGVIVNGRVEVQLPAGWGDGTRVRVLLAEEEDDLGLDGFVPPPETETEEEFLESLRQQSAAIKAGERGMSVEEAFARVDAELRRLAAEQGT